MKNVHVLPTDKPSRLYLTTKEYIFEKEYSLSTDECQNKNIYITSDEEIKEGDYYIKLQNRQYVNRSGKTKFKGLYKDCKKIILTTDQDLIDDGVQAVEEDFLNWFVKNPSCDTILFEYNEYEIFGNKSKKWIDSHSCYKIIIPKEEPKQETLEEVPAELEPVLAKITYQNDLGLSQWYEVVYYDTKWRSYSGSKTFEDGERVIYWKYCKDLI